MGLIFVSKNLPLQNLITIWIINASCALSIRIYEKTGRSTCYNQMHKVLIPCIKDFPSKAKTKKIWFHSTVHCCCIWRVHFRAAVIHPTILDNQFDSQSAIHPATYCNQSRCRCLCSRGWEVCKTGWHNESILVLVSVTRWVFILRNPSKPNCESSFWNL